jgi:hypothetical protein
LKLIDVPWQPWCWASATNRSGDRYRSSAGGDLLMSQFWHHGQS